jgi:DNA-binding MarR family transcriptional regulator
MIRTMPSAVDAAQCASELRIVLGQLTRRLRAEHSFPISHGAVLSRLESSGPMTTSALAAAERVRPQTMAQTLAELHAESLVARTPDSEDRRQVLIELTERGRTALEEDRRRREGWLARAMSEQLTPEEQQVLVDAVPLLRRIVQS